MSDSTIKLLMIDTEFESLPEKELRTQWIKFSNIQAAEYLAVDKYSIERFKDWMASGDDADAWS